MVEANLRLVVSMRRKYTKPGLAGLDFIQEGKHRVLMKAVGQVRMAPSVLQVFDYATWWIRRPHPGDRRFSTNDSYPVPMNRDDNKLIRTSRRAGAE